MENLLKSKKLRVTAFRIEVLKAFDSFENAIDLGVLESKLGEFDRVTLYRTLKIFVEKGLLHEIFIGGESKKYALCTDQCESDNHNHDHLHFLCMKCNETFCLEPDEMPIIEHSSVQITSFEIQAKGFCLSCR